MRRSQSQEIYRVTYQSLPSRMKRLKAQSNGYNSIYQPHSSLSYSLSHARQNNCFGIRSSASYYPNLRIQESGTFDIDISKYVGRVPQYIGMKKYSQRQVRDAIQKESKKYLMNREPLHSKQLNNGCKKYGMIGEKLYKSYRMRNLLEESSKKLSRNRNYYDNDLKERLQNKEMLSSQGNKCFEVGKIYTNEELNKLELS